MIIYLIRHAESELNRDRRVVGGKSTWAEINALGIQQSRALGAWCASRGLSFDRLCCSSAVRTQQTARYVLEEMGGVLGRRIETFAGLLEADQGDWEGRPRLEVYTEEVRARFEADAWNVRPPGGESQADVAARMDGWFREHVLEAQSSTHEHVAVFSHGMSIRCLYTLWAGHPRAQILEIPVENTSVTRFRVVGGEPEQISLNEVDHLREAGLESLSGLVRPHSDRVELSSSSS